MALHRIAMPSPNYSSRGGAGVRLIVLHTAEGARSIESLANFFANPSSGVSSHVGIDDKVNTVGEYVRPDYKAWTAANANPVAVQAELCAFAAWNNSEWHSHPAMLENCGHWVAEEAARFNIPIVRLSPSQAQGSGRGVCQHVDLGSWGGGHTDCGTNFPMDEVLAIAGGAPPTTTPPPVGGGAPPFPYPSHHYLGQPASDPACHSGYYGGVDQSNVWTWQQRMQERGWSIEVDGQYGGQSESIARQFQAEKGLVVDGIVGPETWRATWESPVT